MSILITGGMGFIGLSLANKLVELDYSVTVVDLKELPRRGRHLSSRVEVLKADISDYEQISILEKSRFEAVFHCAAQTSARISQESPERDVDSNVKGTLNVCELARRSGNAKIIFTSSMAVYGNVLHDSIAEGAKVDPLSNYGVSKYSAEMYVKLYEKFGLKSTIFRLFNVFGPGQDYENLKQGMASIFVAQCIKDRKIDVTGSLDRYRDFVYIDDVISALVLGLDGSTDHGIFNVGSGELTTVDELIKKIIVCDGSAVIPVTNIGGHEGDQFGSLADSSTLKSLGWKCDISLDEGLERMMNDARGFYE